MASPARPAAASVSGAFGLSLDPKRCSFDQALRQKDFQENRLLMSFVNFHEQEKISKEKIVTDAIESCMKKQADNLLNSLEVISGRLSQLELYCYKLERSIGELRSDVMDYHNEANLNFQCLEKQVKEVQKSVQVVQEKQEFAETQKEMSKLQIHEDSAQKSEGTAPSVFMTRENEVALVPLHQVNAVQSPAVQFQSCSGLILQQLVPVQDHQRSNQTAVYCMRGQSHPEHRQAQMFQAAAQSVQTHTRKTQPHTVVEVPQVSSQAPEFYPQPQHQWQHQTGQQVQSQARQPQPQVVQQQQYSNIQQGPAQMIQLQTSSPHAHSTPQVTLVYPPYGAHQSACGNAEARTGGMVVPPSYSTISSSQQKHHEAAPIYVQSNTVSVPLAEQHQQLHSLNNGSFVPQPSKVNPCGVASYAVQGNAQTYSPAYGSPSSNPATIVAVLNQQAHCSAPMVLHHLGPQSVQNHPVDIAEKVARMGYSKDQAEGLALRMVAAGQPAEYNHLHDRLSSVGHGVAPHAWSG
ncbi:uncharacterized protein [Miscanthus floridulus]|uniref:uncharacterized protein isoform X1 n=1 Tax=Miscanthus floridulus TaxID=154761 RepID=UPI00345AAE8E